jgi:uncharacterized protein (DUF362 family)/Pyruvate/2-oxoacid:ferredoxin oxidoreductase delta subunit
MFAQPLAVVAIAQIEPSGDNAVGRAVTLACDRLGGLGRFVRPGMAVLIKPDLSMREPGRWVEQLQMVTAMGRLAQTLGAEVAIGDSPTLLPGSVKDLWEKTGLDSWAGRNAFRPANFEGEGSRPYPVKTRVYCVARSVVEADLVINVAGLTRIATGGLCGALDNLLGVLPGFHKMTFLRRTLRPRRYAQTLVDLYSVVKPGLSVLLLDGDRPGKTTHSSGRDAAAFVLASADGVAVDAIAAQRVGLAPESVPAIRIAAEAGLGIAWPEAVSVVGETPFSARSAAILRKTVPTRSLISGLREDLAGALGSWRPQRQISKCRECGACRVCCPAGSARWLGSEGAPDPGKGLCLSCWCCVERCPHNAMTIRGSWLAAKISGLGAKSAPSKILLDKALYSL